MWSASFHAISGPINGIYWRIANNSKGHIMDYIGVIIGAGIALIIIGVVHYFDKRYKLCRIFYRLPEKVNSWLKIVLFFVAMIVLLSLTEIIERANLSVIVGLGFTSIIYVVILMMFIYFRRASILQEEKTQMQTKTYTSSSYRYYPNIYAQENGSGIDLATTNDPNSAVKTDGIGQSDSYYSSPTTETYAQASSSLTVTQTYYNRLMSSTYYKNSTFYNLVHSGSTYWLASRFVNTYSDYANFGLRRVPSGSLGGNSLFRSDNGMYSLGIRLRPVVSLKSNIRLSSGDGSSSSPYQIAD